MKNLIVTVGILLLMTTGMLYELDCRDLMLCERRVKWACEDAAYAAAAVMDTEEQNGQPDEETVLTQAEGAAEESLRRNLKLDESMHPLEEDTFFQGPVRWRLNYDGYSIAVTADCGAGNPRLDFLKEIIHIKSEYCLIL